MQNTTKTRIEYNGKSNSDGRCSFTLCWEDNYFPGHPEGEHVSRERKQCFFADPKEYGHPRPEDVANVQIQK